MDETAPAQNTGRAERGSPASGRLRVAMLQDGARLHYAVPIALQRGGVLSRVFADWYAAPGSFEWGATAALAGFRPALARRMSGRYSAELDASRVVRNPALTLRLLLDRRRFGSEQAYFAHMARELSRWVLRHGWGPANAFMSFISNAHPVLYRGMRRAGVTSVGDQIIAPARVQLEEARRQAERFGAWQTAEAGQMEGLEQAAALERESWPLLDHITCGSEYVRQGLVGQGVDSARVSVLPYPLDAGEYRFTDRSGRSGPLTVGFVGGVSLRKGAPYFVEVARRLRALPARFVMVGPVQVSSSALSPYADDVQVMGAVPRSEVASWLERFDIFLFPSTCEGSATAVMEAMARGLPVVTTPNSGSVARDGLEGLISPHEEIDRLAHGVERLIKDADLRLEMGRAARRRVEEFHLDWYSRELRTLLERLLRGRRTVDSRRA